MLHHRLDDSDVYLIKHSQRPIAICGRDWVTINVADNLDIVLLLSVSLQETRVHDLSVTSPRCVCVGVSETLQGIIGFKWMKHDWTIVSQSLATYR